MRRNYHLMTLYNTWGTCDELGLAGNLALEVMLGVMNVFGER